MISLNTDKAQRIRCYEMLMMLLKSKSNYGAVPGCYTLHFVESCIYFISQYVVTKIEIHVKLMCNYYQSKHLQNWWSDKNFTAPVHKLFDNLSKIKCKHTKDFTCSSSV